MGTLEEVGQGALLRPVAALCVITHTCAPRRMGLGKCTPMARAWSIRAQQHNASPGRGLLQPLVLLFARHLDKQIPSNSRQHSRPSKQVAQSLLWLGSTPFRFTCPRCCSSTRTCNQQGVPTDDTSHPPMVSCIAASRHLSLPQRRRFHTTWARHNTQSLCSVRSGTGRSAKDVSPHSGSLLIVEVTVSKTLLTETEHPPPPCGRLATDHVCTARSIPDVHTASLTFSWPVAGMFLAFRQTPGSAILRLSV